MTIKQKIAWWVLFCLNHKPLEFIWSTPVKGRVNVFRSTKFRTWFFETLVYGK